MKRKFVFLDLSGSNIALFSIHDNSSLKLENELPFEIGFEEDNPGKIKTYSGKELGDINLTDRAIKFTKLAENFNKIDDDEVIRYIFKALFDKLLEKVLTQQLSQETLNKLRTPESQIYLGESKSQIYPGQDLELYLIIPYNWSAEKRIQIRDLLRNFPKIKFKGFLNEIICSIIYYFYLDTEKERLRTAIEIYDKIDLFILDFRLINPKIIYIKAGENKSEREIIIKNISYFKKGNLISRYGSPNLFGEKLRNNLNHPTQEIEEIPVQSNLFDTLNTLIEKEDINKNRLLLRGFGINSNLADELNAWVKETKGENFNPEDILSFNTNEDIVTNGGVKFISILNSPAQLDKVLSFKYNFIFGIQIDAERIYPLISGLPGEVVFPYEQKKEFKIEGSSEGIRLNLYCGLSDKLNSGIRISSIEVKPDTGLRHKDKLKFTAKVKLDDMIRGVFEIVLPFEEVLSKKFRVPVIME